MGPRLECQHCYWIWDDDDPNDEVCECLEKHGYRKVKELGEPVIPGTSDPACWFTLHCK